MTKLVSGSARMLSSEELNKLFNEGFTSPRDKALFGICFFTGCRISEALQLLTSDITKDAITFRKDITKGKLQTRRAYISNDLQQILKEYTPRNNPHNAMFPGKRGVSVFLSRDAADKILRKTCKSLGLEGVSTHSFRRTALTLMSNSNVPLRHIQEISGHRDLGALQKYLEVTDKQIKDAADFIKF